MEELSALNGTSSASNKGSYKLACDIDAKDQTFSPILYFGGTLDGDGFVIKNMTKPLFTSLAAGGTVQNLGLYNSNITAAGANSGALAMTCINANVKIENCWVENLTITSTQANAKIGSLIGYVTNNSLSINNCAVLNSTITSTGTGTCYVAGLVGYFSLSTNKIIITNTYAYNYTGTVNSGKTNTRCNVSSGDDDAKYVCLLSTTGSNTEEIGGKVNTKINANRKYFDHFALTEGATYSTRVTKADLETAIGNGNISINNQALIPSEGIEEDYPPIKSVTLKEGGELIDNSGTLSKITSEYALTVGQWNLRGIDVNETSLDSRFNNSQKASANDMAVVAYNYDAGNWSDGTYLSIKNGDQLVKGEGYFIWPFDAKPEDKSLEGEAASKGEKITLAVNGNIFTDNTISVTKTLSGDKTNEGYWMALANPYTAALKASQLAKDMQGEAVYVYNDGWSDNIKNTDLTIKPGQGFMVAFADKGEKTFTFSKPTEYESAAKKSSLDNSLMTFTCTAGGNENTVYARMNDKAENGFDKKDAFILLSSKDNGNAEPYFVVEQRKILKNEFKSLPYEVPVNFHTEKSVETDFTVGNVPEGIDVYIKDLTYGNMTLVSDGTSYRFTADEGENEGRFVIAFAEKKSAIDNDASEVNVSVINDNNRIQIKGYNLMNVKMINTLGMTVYNKDINSDWHQFDFNQPSGVYIYKVTTALGSKSGKIVIK